MSSGGMDAPGGSNRRFLAVSDCAENDNGQKTNAGRKQKRAKNENTENETGKSASFGAESEIRSVSTAYHTLPTSQLHSTMSTTHLT